jgi:hypothetical protein
MSQSAGDKIDRRLPTDVPQYGDEKFVAAGANDQNSLGTGSMKDLGDVEGQKEVEDEKLDGWYEKYHIKHVVRGVLLCLWTG